MFCIVPDNYPESFIIIPVGRQKHPLLNYEEDHCDIIIDKKFNLYTLRVPASGSHYVSITEEEAKKILKK